MVVARPQNGPVPEPRAAKYRHSASRFQGMSLLAGAFDEWFNRDVSFLPFVSQPECLSKP